MKEHLVMLLLFMALLVACGREQVVYVPVTVTPADAGSRVITDREETWRMSATPKATSEQGDKATPPVPEPAEGRPLTDAGIDMGRIAFMGTVGQSQAAQRDNFSEEEINAVISTFKSWWTPQQRQMQQAGQRIQQSHHHFSNYSTF